MLNGFVDVSTYESRVSFDTFDNKDVRTIQSLSFLSRFELESQAMFEEQKELRFPKLVWQLYSFPRCSNADSEVGVGTYISGLLHLFGSKSGSHSMFREQNSPLLS